MSVPELQLYVTGFSDSYFTGSAAPMSAQNYAASILQAGARGFLTRKAMGGGAGMGMMPGMGAGMGMMGAGMGGGMMPGMGAGMGMMGGGMMPGMGGGMGMMPGGGMMQGGGMGM